MPYPRPIVLQTLPQAMVHSARDAHVPQNHGALSRSYAADLARPATFAAETQRAGRSARLAAGGDSRWACRAFRSAGAPRCLDRGQDGQGHARRVPDRVGRRWRHRTDLLPGQGAHPRAAHGVRHARGVRSPMRRRTGARHGGHLGAAQASRQRRHRCDLAPWHGPLRARTGAPHARWPGSGADHDRLWPCPALCGRRAPGLVRLTACRPDRRIPSASRRPCLLLGPNTSGGLGGWPPKDTTNSGGLPPKAIPHSQIGERPCSTRS